MPTGLDVIKTAWLATHPAPVFSLDREYYDTTKYLGRVRYIFSIFNPRNCLIPDEEILQSLKRVEEFKQAIEETTKTGRLSQVPYTDREMWRAKHVVNACVHPTSGEILPFTARIAFFLPANVPLNFGMLNLSQTASATILWQWLNQS